MRPAFSLSLSSSLACLLCLMLSGCSLSSTSAPTPETGLAIQGRVLGGQQPIVNAHVYLFAANATGYGGGGLSASSNNASLSLLNAATTGLSDSVGAYVLTNSTGGFTITGDYSCTLNQQVYLYALGGSSSSTTNSAAGLLAVLGSCPGGNSAFAAGTPFIAVNEVSTVAAAYAFAGFATDATHVSSSGTALAKTGIANAFANSANLAGISTGVALATTPAGNGTVPQSEINTLANILAACMNSSGPSFTACSTLFSNAESAGSTGTPPTDTATAAINIAHNPGVNISALYALQTANSPFQPTLTAVPNDFTVAISFTGAGLGQPESIVIDAAGNVWVGNQYPSSISKFSNIGAPISGPNGFTGGGLGGPDGIAIDASGNLWVANFYVNSTTFADVYGLVEFSSTGAPISGGISGYTGGGLDLPEGVAIDASGNVWVVNRGSGSLSEFNSSGTAISGGLGFIVSGSYLAGNIVIDASGNFWGDNEFSTISEVTFPGGGGIAETPYGCCDLYSPGGVAIDPSGNLWVVNWDYPGNTPATDIVELSSSGSPISVNGGYTAGGVDYPIGIGSDGAGNIWVSNVQGPILTELNPSGSAISPSTGYQTSQGYGNGLAIDGSGNIWLSSNINTDIVEFVGAASPVVTPVVANLMLPYGQHAVNLP